MDKARYIKALNRATLYGVTWYKGQWMMTARQLGVKPHKVLSPAHRSLPRIQQKQFWLRTHSPTNSPRLVFARACTLSMVKWGLFRFWIQGQSFDCLCLQNTPWTFTGEWEDGQFAYIHAGAFNHRGGLPSSARFL